MKKLTKQFAGLAIAALAPLAVAAQQPSQEYPPQQPPPQNYPQQQPPPQYYPQQQPPPQYNSNPPYTRQTAPQYNAQYNQQPPPPMPPQQLESLVQPIALYPDPLLAQVLTAATYWNEIPDAAGWASEHRFLTGESLARAITEDRLPWDPSVVALLPFPSVLDMMARDMGWTQALGNAVLGQRPEVMDAVQRLRERAQEYGYLQNTAYDRVVGEPGDIQILPADPGYLYVPSYDPYVVFARPRAGFFVGGAINWGPRVYLGASFAPWGWTAPVFGWRGHDIIIDRSPWGRDFHNRDVYVHPYARPYFRPEGGRIERHEFHEHGRERR